MLTKEAAVDLLSGSVGGACGVLVGQPMDTVKVKLQTFPQNYKGTFHCFLKTLRRDGVRRGLYAGTLPSLVANIGENSVLFAAYGINQRLISRICGYEKTEDMSLVSLAIAGSCSAFWSSLIICPSELVKCKLQAAREMGGNMEKFNISSTIRQILKEDGVRGLFTGQVSTWSREMPGYFFFFSGYEFSRSMLTPPGSSKDELGPLQTMACGGVAGVTFWTSVFPMDVIKSRIQVKNDRRGILQVGLGIARNEGVSALYSGLTPSLLRTFPATAALFLGYETAKQFINNQILYN